MLYCVSTSSKALSSTSLRSRPRAMELFVAPLRDFRAGVLTNVRGCYDYWSLPTGKKYTTNGLKSLAPWRFKGLEGPTELV